MKFMHDIKRYMLNNNIDFIWFSVIRRDNSSATEPEKDGDIYILMNRELEDGLFLESSRMVSDTKHMNEYMGYDKLLLDSMVKELNEAEPRTRITGA